MKRRFAILEFFREVLTLRYSHHNHYNFKNGAVPLRHPLFQSCTKFRVAHAHPSAIVLTHISLPDTKYSKPAQTKLRKSYRTKTTPISAPEPQTHSG